jgi:hypothetical protein
MAMKSKDTRQTWQTVFYKTVAMKLVILQSANRRPQRYKLTEKHQSPRLAS